MSSAIDLMYQHSHPILIVEDDIEIARLIAEHLRDIGIKSEHAKTLASAWNKLRQTEYAMLVLDIGLPDGEGYQLCSALRKKEFTIPILFLSCRSQESDKIIGLELGADDYLTKPFSARELTARIKALLRRCGWGLDSPVAEKEIVIGEIAIDCARRQVKRGDTVLALTSTEFDLLLHLAKNAGRPFSREQLLAAVWGYDAGEYEHTVNTHVNRLRSKIEPNVSQPTYVRTVWGVGYRFVEKHELSS